MRRKILYTATFLIVLCMLENVQSDAPPLNDSSILPKEHRQVYGPPTPQIAGHSSSSRHNEVQLDDVWPLGAPNDSPQIKNLQVHCEKTHMRVSIGFDRPFYGAIFSKGFYSDEQCVHLKLGTGHLSATFEIFLNSCGMLSSSENHNSQLSFGGVTPSGSYLENTIIIQYDPYVQEVWDQARKLRCTWYNFYEKQVSFRPFQVDMLHAVTANFLGDNLKCWMQIQIGKGPWASEVSGIVKIGQAMTMVLAIKDDENKFDMLVRNCVAHDGKRAPIQLVDQNGCVARPKIMSKFQKIKNFGESASVVSFAYFQAFKFPDSMNVHFQCVIQVCRFNCPEPKCGIDGEYGLSARLVDPNRGHPDDFAGAFSEHQPIPHALIAAATSDSNNVISNSSPSASKVNDIYLPPLSQPYQTAYSANVKRKDILEDDTNLALAILGGRPRSVNVEGVHRQRRETMEMLIVPKIYKRSALEMTDINTSRVIHVVAPDDVNFALNNAAANNSETVVIHSARVFDTETVCMSVSSFVSTLTMLLFILVIASLVATFLFVRMRHCDRTGIATMGFMSEFIKVI